VWALPATLCVALAVTAAVLSLVRHEPPRDSDELVAPGFNDGWTPPPSANAKAVSLLIDFGNGEHREFTALPWSLGMTVGEVLKAAQQFRPGIRFTQQGDGAMALLTAVDGVVNNPAIDRFWFYEIDGKRAEVSFGVQQIEPGQQVRWFYASAGP
jgi:hypothetical protein